MQYTDTQLKQALAKMLPEIVHYRSSDVLYWTKLGIDGDLLPVLDTELLHLCWLVEETLKEPEKTYYLNLLYGDRHEADNEWKQVHATWQQRTIALAKVKGIEI